MSLLALVFIINMRTGNLFTQVTRTDDEFLEIIFSGNNNFRVERIVSQGHISPQNLWYDQNESEFAAVLQGHAKLEFEHKILTLNPGDWVIIPPHEKHKVIYTSSEPACVWLAVFGVE